MKKNFVFPMMALFGSCAAFALRLLQNRTGFEVSTGLPIPGDPCAVGLLLLLVALTLGYLLGTRLLPEEPEKAPFSSAFSTSGAGIPALLVTGAFLMIASGGAALYSGLRSGGDLSMNPGVSAGLLLALGALTAVSGGCLLAVISTCRRHSRQERTPENGNLLLLPVGYFVLRLVLTFRADSINPSLMDYYPELLALVFLTVSFYNLAAFAFGAGRNRRFALWSALSMTFCAVTLADDHDLSLQLLYAACFLLQVGFLLLRLDGLSAPIEAKTAPERELAKEHSTAACGDIPMQESVPTETEKDTPAT